MKNGKTKIQVIKHGQTGYIAYILNQYEELKFEITSARSMRTPAGICKQAAKTLRILADRFDRLAEQNDILDIVTQRKVNDNQL